ncbi:hypothetical protein B0H11DRAFT_1943930 [Mycena galericulata]|nr:hypothetical protein B0H11DRAFT_1943930 [Mycena galericulata]
MSWYLLPEPGRLTSQTTQGKSNDCVYNCVVAKTSAQKAPDFRDLLPLRCGKADQGLEPEVTAAIEVGIFGFARAHQRPGPRSYRYDRDLVPKSVPGTPVYKPVYKPGLNIPKALRACPGTSCQNRANERAVHKGLPSVVLLSDNGTGVCATAAAGELGKMVPDRIFSHHVGREGPPSALRDRNFDLSPLAVQLCYSNEVRCKSLSARLRYIEVFQLAEKAQDLRGEHSEILD